MLVIKTRRQRALRLVRRARGGGRTAGKEEGRVKKKDGKKTRSKEDGGLFLRGNGWGVGFGIGGQMVGSNLTRIMEEKRRLHFHKPGQ